MGHTNVAVSTTATPQAIPVTAPESPQLKAYVEKTMQQFGVTEQEVKKAAVETYGSLENAMRLTEATEAQNKAALLRAFPNGYAEIQVGVSDVAFLNLKADFPTCSRCQRKPKPGEEVTFTELRDGVMIRVWGGDLASYQCYCFDFVNRERQYILTPDDVEIYSVATAFSPGIRVLSIEQSLEKAKATSLYSDVTRRDPNWETYIIREGTVLRITQRNHSDRYLHIPMRTPNNATLVLQPWRAWW
jgi:hypothetical protein